MKYLTDEEIKDVGVFSIFLGHYFFWDARKQLEIIKTKNSKLRRKKLY